MMNESGQGTIDFLLATVLIVGTSALVMALTIALTLTEVVQYVSFSGARAYFAGAVNSTDQELAAKVQVDALLKNLPYLQGAMNSGWIKVTPRGARNYRDYAESRGAVFKPYDRDDVRNQFVGYQLVVDLPLLTFNIPLLGNLVQSKADTPVQVTVSSFLLREPTTSECETFNNRIYEAIINKDTSYSSANGKSKITPTAFRAINDNGC